MQVQPVAQRNTEDQSSEEAAHQASFSLRRRSEVKHTWLAKEVAKGSPGKALGQAE